MNVNEFEHNNKQISSHHLAAQQILTRVLENYADPEHTTDTRSKLAWQDSSAWSREICYPSSRRCQVGTLQKELHWLTAEPRWADRCLWRHSTSPSRFNEDDLAQGRHSWPEDDTVTIFRWWFWNRKVIILAKPDLTSVGSDLKKKDLHPDIE